MSTMVQVTPDSTRDELEICMAHLVYLAKQEARRGYAGTRGRRYRDLHANIDTLLTSWQRAA